MYDKKEYMKKYYQKNKSRLHQQNKENYYKHQEREKIRRHLWHVKNYSKVRERLNSTRQKKELALKIEVLTYYSQDNIPKCVCCGEVILEFLTIDHEKGRKFWNHKREMGGSKLYKWLKNSSFPQGFQTMCINCNFAKGTFGVCPHSTDQSIF